MKSEITAIRSKGKYQQVKNSDPQTEGSLSAGDSLRKVKSFRYLRSYVTSEKNAQKGVNERVNTAWSKGTKCKGPATIEIQALLHNNPSYCDLWLVMLAHDQNDKIRVSVIET